MNGNSCVPLHCVAVLVPRQTWGVLKQDIFLQHSITSVLWLSLIFIQVSKDCHIK